MLRFDRSTDTFHIYLGCDMTIRVVCVGKLKEKFWVDACAEYKKRLGRFCKLEIIEVAEENKYNNIEQILSCEENHILEKLEGKYYLMDQSGIEYTSEQLATLLKNDMLSHSTLTFIIGGSYGVSQKVKQSCPNKLSFGKITYPHNLARVILLEQIYRVFMINSGSSYHK